MTKAYKIIFEARRGTVSVPEECASVRLNPLERTLYRFFVIHPEGIPTESLAEHRKELRTTYEHETRFDNKQLMDSVIESLCAESKTVFYSTVSRIKKKFVDALGSRKAAPYIVKRGKDGRYRTRARASILTPRCRPSSQSQDVRSLYGRRG